MDENFTQRATDEMREKRENLLICVMGIIKFTVLRVKAIVYGELLPFIIAKLHAQSFISYTIQLIICVNHYVMCEEVHRLARSPLSMNGNQSHAGRARC
jgi:hypothetical protein